ncbi:MAG: hypothetical protein CMI56_02510 [Parcubacteria group bacterium]|nr:hypothetical protein [Parcubacteria group bacterium]
MLKKGKSFYNDLFVILLAFVLCLVVSNFINKDGKHGKESFYSVYESGNQGVRPRSLNLAKSWASTIPDSETRKKPDKHNDKPYIYQDYIGEIKEIYKVYNPKERETSTLDTKNLYEYIIDEMRRINGTRKILDIRSFQEYL